MAEFANLEIYQGDDYAATVTVSDSTGLPADLTGFSAQAQIRLGPADENPDVVVEFDVTLDPPDKIELMIPHATTEQLTGRYVWDLQLIDAVGIVTTILSGTVQVICQVTRGY